MKTLCLLLLIIFSLPSMAQVKSKVTYDKDTKALILTLTNDFNEKIFLSPKGSYPHFIDEEASCWYQVWWKNQDSTVVSYTAPEMIYESHLGCYMPAHSTRSFRINLKSNKPNIKSMKILFHIEVHTREKDPIQWKEEFTKTFEY